MKQEPKQLTVCIEEKRFGQRGEGDRRILESISFKVKPKQVVALIGRSGIGKTTVLRIIAGLDSSYSGHIVFNDCPITHPNRKIGMVFQDSRLFPWMTVRENLLFSINTQNDGLSAEASLLISETLKKVDLLEAEGLYPNELSGGMQKRAALARALVSLPEILLLDEPFAGLDPFAKAELQHYLDQIVLESNIGVVISSHDIDGITFLADIVHILAGSPATIEQTVKLDASRPRSRTSQAYKNMQDQLNNALKNAIDKK